MSTSVLAAAPAQAETEEIGVSYGVTGHTVLKKTNSTVALGPGALDGALIVNTDTGAISLRANLTLPPATADISLAQGLAKIKAKITVIPTSPVTGTLSNGSLTMRSTVSMQISDIRIGIGTGPVLPVPTLSGACQTVKPIDLNLVSKNVDVFAPSFPADGVYTIPDFKNCLVTNVAVGALVSGPGNPLHLDLASKN